MQIICKWMRIALGTSSTSSNSQALAKGSLSPACQLGPWEELWAGAGQGDSQAGHSPGYLWGRAAWGQVEVRGQRRRQPEETLGTGPVTAPSPISEESGVTSSA